MPLRKSLLLAASIIIGTPAFSDPDAGSYLAGRQAGILGDYGSAARYFSSALLADAANPMLMEQTLTAYLGAGQIESAAGIARPFLAAGGESQLASIALMAQAARAENWDAIFDQLEAGQEVGPLIDSLAQAWAHFGKGNQRRAFETFDEVIDTPGLRAFGQQHKAFALTIAGDLAAANEIYLQPPNLGIPPTRTSIIAHLQVLARLGDFDRAQDMIDRAFTNGDDPELRIIRDAIGAGDIPQLSPTVASPQDGIAFAYLSLADILQGEADDSFLLLFAQAARHIAPQNAQSHITAARLLNALDQSDAASSAFAQVLEDNPAFYDAELGRAESLRLAGRLDEAIESLTQLTQSHPDFALSFASLGDIYRQQEDFDAAVDAYTAALDGYPEDASIRWWILFSRGIAHERQDLWEVAEADFRASLSLNPDHPSVLNYLGYSMVDRGQTENYREALTMIETAVAVRPDSGAIVDSLAWVYYKLGRYEDAVAPMERAVELEPNDPIISDHLGDVYWMVGREIEARFQWRRALSFGPEPSEADRIRRKLTIGLDAVYIEDGEAPAPAIEAVNDDS